MERKEYKLDKETNDFRIESFCSDISVYPDNVKSPIIFATTDVDIKNEWHVMHDGKYAKIKEKPSSEVRTTNVYKSIDGVNIFGVSNSVVITSGNIIINGHNICGSEPGLIELVVPKGNHITSIEAKTKSGDINVRDINIGTLVDRLIAEAMSGDITLERFNALYTRLKTYSGDIDVEVLESMLNYELNLSSISGDTQQRSIETVSPQIVYDKYKIDAEAKSGDIKVLFKGKTN